MAQVKCPKGHFYNDKIYSECPYCGNVPPPDDDEFKPPPPPTANRFAQILAAFAAVIAVASFLFVSSQRQDLAAVEWEISKKSSELQEIIQESEKEDSTLYISKIFINDVLNPVYGRASDNFYADSPVVILETGGSSKTLNIHSDFQESFLILHDALSKNFTDGWCTDINAEWEGNAVKITPGSTEGFNFIHFFNKKDNTISFDVLIIVK